VLQVLKKGDQEVPRALAFFPAYCQPPQKGFDGKDGRIFCLLASNRVGNESYYQPVPVDLHRYHSCENDDAHHLVEFD